MIVYLNKTIEVNYKKIMIVHKVYNEYFIFLKGRRDYLNCEISDNGVVTKIIEWNIDIKGIKYHIKNHPPINKKIKFKNLTPEIQERFKRLGYIK